MRWFQVPDVRIIALISMLFIAFRSADGTNETLVDTAVLSTKGSTDLLEKVDISYNCNPSPWIFGLEMI